MKRRFSPVSRSALAAAACLAGAWAGAAPSTTVTTAQGQIDGMRVGTVTAYRGIPYAMPPVGPNRWRAPQAASSWKGVRPAHDFASSCYQTYPAVQFGPYTS